MKRMKVRSTLAIMLCLLFIPLVLQGCGSYGKIIGKWVLYNGIKDGIIVEFNPNGTGQVSDEFDREAFRWKLSEEELTLTYDDGSTLSYHIRYIGTTATGKYAMFLDHDEGEIYLEKRSR